MRTANPALNANTFKTLGIITGSDTMTLDGTVNKTIILLILLLIPAAWVWNLFFQSHNLQAIAPFIWLGALGGFIVALVTVFKKEWAGITSPLYAVLEGLVLGGISSIFEFRFPGIVIQAVALTFGTLFCLLMAYKSGFIRPTENFKLGVVSATGAIALIYIITIILGFLGIKMPYIHGSGIIGIIFSIFVVTIAALNLVLDFDFIESGAKSGAPKYMEWYAAFGLMVTLIWLYIEILRLLAKLRSRN